MTAAAPTAGAAGRVDVSRISGSPRRERAWSSPCPRSSARTAVQHHPVQRPATGPAVLPRARRRAPRHRDPAAARRARHPQTLRGHDAVLVEAADRSDSALVLAGPYHEATTWFGGPTPDAAGVQNLLATFRFTDSARGASLVPASPLVRQSAWRSSGAVRARSSSCGPPWTCSRRCPSGPASRCLAGLWRTGRVLNPEQSRLVAGTAHPVALPRRRRHRGDGPGPARARVRPAGAPLGEAQVVDALTGLLGRWGI